MDCGSALVKYILFLFNLLCAICGILLIVFGSIVLTNVAHIQGVTEYNTTSIPIIAIVLGCIVFLIAFMGCCGAIKENNCMTMTYSILLLVLLVCQVVFVVFVWVKQTEFLDTMGKVVDTMWNKQPQQNAIMDPMQIEFKCCGRNGPLDWTLNGGSIPNTCCGRTANSCDILSAYNVGCRNAFVDAWKTNINLVKFVGLGIALIEFVGVVFACCLSNSIRNSRRRGVY